MMKGTKYNKQLDQLFKLMPKKWAGSKSKKSKATAKPRMKWKKSSKSSKN